MALNQRPIRLLISLSAMLLAPACREWKSPDENVLTVAAYSAAMDSAQTFATVEIPGLTRALNTAQLSASARFAVRAKSGTIHVRYVQVKGRADTVGRAEISLDIVKGYTYYASLTRDRAGVSNYCIGCSGWLTFPMIGSQRASTDLLRLNYLHGLPLCKGCVALRTNVGIKVAKRD